jgi:hypothetical protein
MECDAHVGSWANLLRSWRAGPLVAWFVTAQPRHLRKRYSGYSKTLEGEILNIYIYIFKKWIKNISFPMKFSKIYPCGRDLQLSTKAADFFQLPKCSEFNGKNQIFPRLQNSAKILDICIKSQDFFCYWTKSRFCTCFKLKKIREWNSNLDILWSFRDISNFDKILEKLLKMGCNISGRFWSWGAKCKQ